QRAQLSGLQDELTCSVCLDTLTDPVTIPCGHMYSCPRSGAYPGETGWKA
uniref:Zinc finger RING-type eukaryotic domain-containing protein n=1 Tax=Erpetoichthys calabaricus TaxID=27687 RepID=A0A8C4STC4_ERPCA